MSPENVFKALMIGFIFVSAILHLSYTELISKETKELVSAKQKSDCGEIESTKSLRIQLRG